MSSSRSVRSLMIIPALAMAMAVTVASWGDPKEAIADNQYRISGKWLTRRGTAFIPLLAAKAVTTMDTKAGNCLGGVANPCYVISGGIGIEGIATQTGSGGAGKQLTIPAGAANGNPLFLLGTRNVFAIPANPSVIQVSTMFVFSGPTADGVFKQDFGTHSTGGRLAPSFTWCPGANTQNPACGGQPGLGGTGSRNGLVRYAQGANKFGGTMKQLLAGGGDLSLVADVGPPLKVLHNIIGGGGGTQIFGGAYAGTNQNALPGGNITVPGYTLSGSALVLKPGVNATTITGACPGGLGVGCLLTTGVQVAMAPASTNTNFGFPFTTGMITASVTDVAGATPEIFVTTGADNRTTMAGNIVLVAGGITERGSGSFFSSLEKVSINFLPIKEGVPSMAPVGIVTFTTLMALVGGFALRRRSNRKN